MKIQEPLKLYLPELNSIQLAALREYIIYQKKQALLDDAKQVILFGWDNPDVSKQDLKQIWVKRIEELEKK